MRDSNKSKLFKRHAQLVAAGQFDAARSILVALVTGKTLIIHEDSPIWEVDRLLSWMMMNFKWGKNDDGITVNFAS